MRSSDYSGRTPNRKTSARNGGSGKKFLYDANGKRVPQKRFQGEFFNTLLYWVLPFVVINLFIFVCVTTTPKVDIAVADTHDYKTTEVTFTVSSLVPIKSVQAFMEYEEPLELTKDGNTYTATVDKNGNISVEALSVNGMETVAYENVSILDNTPPQIDPELCDIKDDILTITVTDSQSGVDFDSIYAVDPTGKQISPFSMDREAGTVSFPIYLNELVVYASDMVGNPVQANFSTTTEGISDDDTSEDDGYAADDENTSSAEDESDTSDSDS